LLPLPSATSSPSLVQQNSSFISSMKPASHPVDENFYSSKSLLEISTDTPTVEVPNVSVLHMQSPPYLNSLSDTLTVAEEKLLSQGCDLRTLHGRVNCVFHLFCNKNFKHIITNADFVTFIQYTSIQ
jgi:hypothetical protein